MKTNFKLLVGAVVCAVATSVSAITIGSNITIFDGATGRTHGGGTGPGLEDESTDYGATYSQQWDLEGFFWNAMSKTLTGVGGFDFQNGYQGQKAGDVFIDVNGDARIPASTPEPVPPSLQGYDFVLDFGWNDRAGGLGYSIVDLRTGSPVLETSWASRLGSDPYRYVSGGLVLASGLSLVGYDTGLNDDLDGDGVSDVLGGNGAHYAYQLDMTWLSQLGFDSFTVHQTMTCGNDGHNGHVPDGGLTVCLLGITMAGIGIVRRRMRG